MIQMFFFLIRSLRMPKSYQRSACCCAFGSQNEGNTTVNFSVQIVIASLTAPLMHYFLVGAKAQNTKVHARKER
jgi:hypothetical protein